MSKLLKKKNLGSTPTQAPTMSKWAQGIEHHKPKPTTNINVKMLPLRLIKPDPKNARGLILTDIDIQAGPKLKVFPFDEEAQKKFLSELKEFFKDDASAEKKIEEYLSLALLAASIEDPSKLHQPILVIANDYEFCMIFGHRRRLAHFILDAEEILCRIVNEEPSELEHRLTQFKENKDRENLDLSSELRAFYGVVDAWETEHQQSISISKVMALLQQKKTKAAWVLAVLKHMKDNRLFERAIHSNVITSLEIAYNLTAMEDRRLQEELLNALMAGKEFSYKQMMARIKNPELAVRSPDTLKRKTDYGLKIGRDTNLKALSKIVKLIIKNPEFREHQKEFAMLNIESKPGISKAWEKIFHLLERSGM